MTEEGSEVATGEETETEATEIETTAEVGTEGDPGETSVETKAVSTAARRVTSPESAQRVRHVLFREET